MNKINKNLIKSKLDFVKNNKSFITIKNKQTEKEVTIPFNSYNENFVKGLFSIFSEDADTQFKNMSNVQNNYGFPSKFRGVVLGTSNTAQDYTQCNFTKLTMLNSNYSTSKSGTNIIISQDLQNTSGATVYAKEVALWVYTGHENTICRDTYANPGIEILDNQSVTVTYTLDFSALATTNLLDIFVWAFTYNKDFFGIGDVSNNYTGQVRCANTAGTLVAYNTLLQNDFYEDDPFPQAKTFLKPAYRGIVIGTSDVAKNIAHYSLQGGLHNEANLQIGDLKTLAPTFTDMTSYGIYTIHFSRVFKNLTASSITIEEIGLYIQGKNSSTDDGSAQIMFDRQLYNGDAFTMAANESKEVFYDFSIEVGTAP